MAAGSSGNTVSLAYTAGSTPFVNGTLVLTIPAGWTAPQDGNPSGPGFVAVTQGNASILSVSGNQVTLSVPSLSAGGGLTLSYQDAAAPSQAVDSSFSLASDPTGSSPAALAAQPLVHVSEGTPTPQPGILVVLKALAAPNPNPRALYLDLGGEADEVTLKVYSQALLCVSKATLPAACSQGWNTVDLPASWAQGLSNGVYYLSVQASWRGRTSQAPAPVPVLILR